jgi:hypothetical protein
MLENSKKIIENIFSKIIYDLSKYLFIIFISGIAGLAAHIYAINNKYFLPYAVVFSISIGAGIGAIGFYIYKQRSPIYRIYSEIDFKYLFVKKELTFEYKDNCHMIYQKHVKIKVLCKSLDRYFDKFNWSGCEMPKISCDNKNYEIFLTTKRDAFQQLEVHFGKNYKKGEIIDFLLSFDLTDSENVSTPMLTSTIVEPTEYLKLTVKIPKEYNITKADAEVFPIIDSRLSLYIREMYFDNYDKIEWEILKPNLLLVYSLRWNKLK